MASTSPVGGTSGLETSLVQNADTDTSTNATLIKKALQSEKEMVATLMQGLSDNPSGVGSRLDILA